MTNSGVGQVDRDAAANELASLAHNWSEDKCREVRLGQHDHHPLVVKKRDERLRASLQDIGGVDDPPPPSDGP